MNQGIKFLYQMKNFKTIFLSGDNVELCAELIYFLLKDNLSIKTYFSTKEFFNFLDILGSDLLIFVFDLEKESENIIKMFSSVKNPILVFNGKEFIKDSSKVKYLIDNLSPDASIFFNADNDLIKESISDYSKNIKTSSIENKGTIYASSVDCSKSYLSFKINYQGKTIPFWANGEYCDKEVYSILSAILIAMEMGMNLVEISNKIREFQKPD